jgi:ABC-type multidrug transport system ATPase subunit
MGLFWKQIAALTRKDLLVAKIKKGASLAEIIFPLFCGSMCGAFMLLISIVSGRGNEYAGNDLVAPLAAVVNTTWVGIVGGNNGTLLATAMLLLMRAHSVNVNLQVHGFRSVQAMTQAYEFEVLTAMKEKKAATFLGVAQDERRGNLTVFSSNLPQIDTRQRFIALGETLSAARDYDFPTNTSADVPLDVDIQAIYMTQNLRAIFSSTGVMLLIYAFIPSLMITAGRLVEEKRARVRETLKVMGCSDGAYVLSGALSALIRMAVGTSLISLVLAAFLAITPADIPIVFAICLLFSLSLIAYAQLMPALFSVSMWSNVTCMVLIAGGAILSGLSTGWPPAIQLLCCFVSPIAFYYGVLPSLALGTVTLHVAPGTACVMLIVDTILYAGLAQYIYAVNPGPFGVPRSKLFFVDWIWTSKPPVAVPSGRGAKDDGAEDYRLVVKNMMKYYGTQRHTPSLNGLSLSIKRGEIYALLGHNGAGKTTAMSVMTGMITATTYDTATINGFDITTQMDQIRQSVGLCPQFDVLFADLGARDHLLLFARIKGVANAEDNAEKLLNELELPLDDQRSSTFSGGMKRRLSVANAIVGESSLLLLDEPSSGMDPLSRRQMWDLLKRLKADGRTIVLSTHFMEEADYLGDRIAIMNAGHMFCCETSSVLKQKYGLGFTMTVAKVQGECKPDEICDVLQRHVPEVKKIADGVGDVQFELPTDQLHKFGDMLTAFEGQQQALGVHSYGVTMCTLEDVFVGISAMIEKEHHEKHAAAAGDADDDDVELPLIGGQDPEALFEAAQQATYWQRTRSQAWTTFARKCLMFRRSRRMNLMVTVFPLLFILAAFATAQPQVAKSHDNFMGMTQPDTNNLNLVFVDLRDRADNALVKGEFRRLYAEAHPEADLNFYSVKKYSDFVTGIYLPLHSVSFVSGFKSPPVPCGVMVHHSTLVDAAVAPHANYTVLWNANFAPAFAAPLTEMLQAAAYNVAHGPSAPASRRAVTPRSALHCATAGFPTLAEIEARNNITAGQRAFHLPSQEKKVNMAQIGIYMVLAIGQLVVACATPMADEVSRQVYQVNLAMGMTPLAYFVGNFAFDMLCCCYPVLLFVVGVYVWDIPAFHSSALLMCTLACLLFCVHVVLLSYVLVCYLQGSAAFVYTIIIHLFNLGSLAALYMVTVVFQALPASMGLTQFGKDIHPYVLSLFPSASWYHIVDNTSDFDTDESSAAAIFTFTGICTGWGFVFLVVELALPFYLMRAFATNAPMYRRWYASRQNAAAKKAKHAELAGQSPRTASPAPVDDDARAPLIAGGAGGAGYGSVEEPLNAVRVDSVNNAEEMEDSDVTAERRRVEADPSANMVSMLGLRKQYGSVAQYAKIALKNLSLGVKQSECFGLLGPNGAGKSTTCKLILREMEPTDGDVVFPYAGVNKSSSPNEAFAATRLGVCMQTDTLWEFLTAEEHMEQYMRLRLAHRYEAADCAAYIHATIQKVKLDAAGKPAGGYSGGMKRKLMVCLAMYTGALCVFLDEPSTGMDPFARRALWKVIMEACSQHRSVILTTHSMEEAEAVCSRIGIITAGALRCIGTTQHLKNKFGSGYVITVSLDAAHATKEGQQTVQRALAGHFSNVKLTEALGPLLRFSVEDVPSLAEAFKFLEARSKGLGVAQYSVSQTASLEQIFLSFVATTREDA